AARACAEERPAGVSSNGPAPDPAGAPARPIATHSGLRDLHLTGADVERTVGGLVAMAEAAGLTGAIGLASDGRPGNEELCSQAVEAITARGRDVVDFGVVSTPGAKLAAHERGLAGAVIVTASHLPHGWSGLKLVIAPRYFPVDVGALPEPAERAGTTGERSEDAEAAALHADAVVRTVDADAIRARAPEVGLAGGAGEAGRLMLELLGCRPGGLTADLTLRLDADGDRLALADRGGNELDEETTFALAVTAVRPRRAVKGADTSRMIEDIVAGWAGEVETVPPGELHLVEAVARTGADLAGEGNGGVVHPRVALARDGLAAGALVLDLIARTGASLAELAAGLPAYARRRSRFPCEAGDSARAAAEAIALAYGVDEADPATGVRLELGEGTWAMVRRSATEPVLRITVEGPDRTAVDALHAELHESIAAAVSS
ncbi:MAG: hypothetical protein ACRDL6_00305, partial [Solirubrobacterales bacterium]